MRDFDEIRVGQAHRLRSLALALVGLAVLTVAAVAYVHPRLPWRAAPAAHTAAGGVRIQAAAPAGILRVAAAGGGIWLSTPAHVGQVYVSTDGGATWKLVWEGPPAVHLTALDARTALIDTVSYGVFKLHADSSPELLHIPEANEVSYGLSVDGLLWRVTVTQHGFDFWRSRTGGLSWELLDPPGMSSGIWGLTFDVVARGEDLFGYISTGAGVDRLFELATGSAAWLELPLPPQPGALAVAGDGSLFLATTSALYLLPLRASAWLQQPGSPPNQPESLAASGSKLFLASENGGLYSSADGGLSWARLTVPAH